MRYKVRFYVDYEVEAECEDEALDEAEAELARGFETCHFGLAEMFESEIKEVAKGE